MAKVSSLQRVSNITQWSDASRFIQGAFDDLTTILNGKLLLGDNVSVSIFSYTFQAANTSYKIQHGLSRIPIGYILVKSPASSSLFDGSGQNDSNVIYLQCTQALTVTVMVF